MQFIMDFKRTVYIKIILKLILKSLGIIFFVVIVSHSAFNRDEFELEFSSSSKPEMWRFQAEPSQAWAIQFRAKNELTILTICMSKNSKFLTYFSILLLYHDSNQFHAQLLEYCCTKGVFKVDLDTWFSHFHLSLL